MRAHAERERLLVLEIGASKFLAFRYFMSQVDVSSVRLLRELRPGDIIFCARANLLFFFFPDVDPDCPVCGITPSPSDSPSTPKPIALLLVKGCGKTV
ncbi:MAG: hypothetical protein JMM77_01765 [Candidatus Xiphinematobacter sp.]|nr:MAG: hypothetical protein JMM77_01765 [Candidatus Xiphinematobacter sp.]